MKPADFHAWRQGLGLTAMGAAVALGVAVSTIYRWENGSRRVPEPVAKLCEWLRNAPLDEESRDWERFYAERGETR